MVGCGARKHGYFQHGRHHQPVALCLCGGGIAVARLAGQRTVLAKVGGLSATAAWLLVRVMRNRSASVNPACRPALLGGLLRPIPIDQRVLTRAAGVARSRSAPAAPGARRVNASKVSPSTRDKAVATSEGLSVISLPSGTHD